MHGAVREAQPHRRYPSLPALAPIAACALAIAGCAVAPRTAAPPDATAITSNVDAWSLRRVQLQQRDRFALHGRVAVAVADEGFSATLRWTQRAGTAQIRLEGPLGVGGLHIDAEGSELRLTTNRGERLDGAAARGELERRLGFDLPVEALRYWVQGVPAPGDEAIEHLAADAARLASVEQQGWRIDYLDYVQLSAGPLPRRLSMTRGGARLRLVIESWEDSAP
jgi:outer membrane lipoprotein LolB